MKTHESDKMIVSIYPLLNQEDTAFKFTFWAECLEKPPEPVIEKVRWWQKRKLINWLREGNIPKTSSQFFQDFKENNSPNIVYLTLSLQCFNLLVFLTFTIHTCKRAFCRTCDCLKKSNKSTPYHEQVQLTTAITETEAPENDILNTLETINQSSNNMYSDRVRRPTII